jgi:hypothetical protein
MLIEPFQFIETLFDRRAQNRRIVAMFDATRAPMQFAPPLADVIRAPAGWQLARNPPLPAPATGR